LPIQREIGSLHTPEQAGRGQQPSLRLGAERPRHTEQHCGEQHWHTRPATTLTSTAAQVHDRSSDGIGGVAWRDPERTFADVERVVQATA
jgi:hypothetical protein